MPVAVPTIPSLRSNGDALSRTSPEARPLAGEALQKALQDYAKAAPTKPGAPPAELPANEKKAAQTPTATTQATALAVSGSGGDDNKAPTPADPALPGPPQAMFNGSYTHSIPIEVPAFRGYEPKLKLVYDSNHGLRAGGHNPGWLGSGWHLEGISEIVRVSPRRGTPRFDVTDTWTLDGEELVACVAGMESPSCQNGGTHTGRVENYRRITLDSTANQWRVTRPDGSYDLFVPVGNFPNSGSPSTNLSNLYRYVLQKTVDPNGNEITFSYTCQTLPACTVSTISYGPTTVLLTSETRPDPIETAVGGALMNFTQRLKLIDVVSYGARARAYQLSYDQSPATGASRLVSVQQYGKNAVINGANTITGGDAMPAHVFTYQGATLTPTVASAAEKITLPTMPGGYDFVTAGNAPLFLDFMGRGRADIAATNDYPGETDAGNLACCRFCGHQVLAFHKASRDLSYSFLDWPLRAAIAFVQG